MMLHNLLSSPDQASTFVELLRWRAVTHPERVAFIFLRDGESDEARLTYGELDRQARMVAAHLQEHGSAGERALLLFPAGLEFITAFIGCLYAGVVAVPAYPPHPNRPMTRLQDILANAGATWALATTSILTQIEKPIAATPELQALRWLATDTLLEASADPWLMPEIDGNTLAFLQYTSGSTSTPKGVMVSHGNLITNELMIRDAYGNTEQSVGVSWLPMYHDMGLIGSVLQTLFVGCQTILMAPTAFLQKPIRWLQAIARYKATTSGGPNFAYELCARQSTPEQRAELDLSGWELAFSGAEPVRAETIERFAATFASCGFRKQAFYPCYGMAESTLLISGGPKMRLPYVTTLDAAALEQGQFVEAEAGQKDTRAFVSCGQTWGPQRIMIVDPETCAPCASDQIGEIWVAGPNIAKGYWNQPEKSAETFEARTTAGEGPFLRTGDLGFIQNGELFITGRIKDLIIIRGRNHYPQDIEQTVEHSHPALRLGCSAAFSVEAEGEERLVVVAEIDRRTSKEQHDAVLAAIRQAVAEYHGVELYAALLLRTNTIPKTTSGKIQRYACRAGFLQDKLTVVGAWRQGTQLQTPEQLNGFHKETPAPSVSQKHSASEIQTWLVERLAARVGIAPRDVDVQKPFTSYGLDSVTAVGITGELSDWLGYDLPATLAYEFPTIEAVTQYLANPPQEAPESERNLARIERHEPIAIIGMSCRFPGANSLHAFWELLRDGVDAVREVPADRWDVRAFYDPNPVPKPGKLNTRWGGFLDQIDQFDAAFFGITPREATSMDPQQRMLLEVAWEALEDAAIAPKRLAETATGVFVGISASEYAPLLIGNDEIDVYTATGNALSIAANRISYVFNFRGPSIAVDTACSSSLVAVHLACTSIWNGESSLALAGGANIILSPAVTINFSQAGATSPDGHCKAFDAEANGIVRSEGVGMVVLKPLSEAIADGDPIYAVIRGSAVNQDGSSNGITAPNRWAQEQVLRLAYQKAGVAPKDVQYVETHGTGTLLGDPIEAQALGTVLNEGRAPDSACLIGSLKSNLGHMEAAAGIGSLIKTALALKHRTLPASLYFNTPNPHIPFDTLGLRVQSSKAPWPAGDGPALAGVSAFGFGGTNAHVVLEAAPVQALPAAQATYEDGQAQLLPISARSSKALKALAGAYHTLLADEAHAPALNDLCWSAATRRDHHNYRLAIAARSRAEMLDRLNAFVADETRPGMHTARVLPGRRPKIVFVFPGHGAQWWAMGRELLAEQPVFRDAIDACDALIRQHLGWSLIDELLADEPQSRLDAEHVEVPQVAIFALQVALAALWRAWGVTPGAVVGHSMGEVAAAYVAGALDLPDAVRLICLRSRLMQAVVDQWGGQGAMAAVELSLDDARRALAGYEDRLSIGVQNGPRSVVISGEASALHAILGQLEARNVFCRVLRAPGAGHSPQVDSARVELERLLADLVPQPPQIPIASTVTGSLVSDSVLDAAYWGRNIREPVLFADAVSALGKAGFDVFLELSPHPILSTAITETLRGNEVLVLPSLRRKEAEQALLLGSLGALYTAGYPLDWSKILPEGQLVALPVYPWQQKRFWIEKRGTQNGAATSYARSDASPLLGKRMASAVQAGMHFWQIDLSIEKFPFLHDHQVAGTVVLPAAGYVEMALAAGQEIFGAGAHMLEQVSFKKMLVFRKDSTQTVQVVVTTNTSDSGAFQVLSRAAGADETEQWTLHANGVIRRAAEAAGATTETPATISERCSGTISGADFYQALAQLGGQYGPTFQGVAQIQRRAGEALAQIQLNSWVAMDLAEYQIHPALLDTCFQTLTAAVSDLSRLTGTDIFLPVLIKRLRLHRRPEGALWGHVVLRSDITASLDTVEGDIFLLDERGQVVLEATGLQVQRLEPPKQAASRTQAHDWFYDIAWEPQTLILPEVTLLKNGRWILFMDQGGIGQALKQALEARDQTCVVVRPGDTFAALEGGHYQINPAHPDDFHQFLGEVVKDKQIPCRAVVYLWGLDAAPVEAHACSTLAADQSLVCGSVLHVVQALGNITWRSAPRLWLVTRSTQAVEPHTSAISVSQASLWGLGRVISHEQPELRCSRIDLSLEGQPAETQALLEELWTGGSEDQIALRGGERYVARLSQFGVDRLRTSSQRLRLVDPGQQPFRLEQTGSGSLDSLLPRATTHRTPGPGQIEIQVYAAGLNFSDVIKSLALIPDLVRDESIQLGLECAGIIVALGEGVEGFQVGDEVVAIAPASFSSFTTTLAHFVAHKPAGLSFEQAVTIPVAFLTAYYALCYLGRLRKGERVLIHAATGGVGLAAVQLAQMVGAEIFATAGTPEKRAFLHSLGVQHVMDSRSLAFADQIMELTGGEGIDVVLNSLAGEAISKGLALLRGCGRFLELGKRDIAENTALGLRPFHKNLAFFGVDIDLLFREQALLAGSLLQEIMQQIEEGKLKALPLQQFSVAQATNAFRYMAQAKHIGKIVVTMQGQPVQVLADEALPVYADGSYLITGGLGGLGLTVARWMVEQGARHLVLMGRSGASTAVQAELQTLEQAGTTVVIAQADVTKAEQVAGVVATIKQTMPALRGIIHAAGALDDGVLAQLTIDRFQPVMAPKVDGAWYLHTLTLDAPLDFFVLFSSAASLLGSPGQGNYAAANAFMDALAHYRQAEGRPATSINWGPWAEIGGAAQTNRGGRLGLQGVISLTPEQGVEALGQVLRYQPAQIGVMLLDLQQWREYYPKAVEAPLLTRLVRQQEHTQTQRSTHKILDTLIDTPVHERHAVLQDFLCTKLARVVGIAPSEVDIHQPINMMGIDSLTAVELNNSIEAALGTTVPVVKLLQGPSLQQFSEMLLMQLTEAELAPLPQPVVAEQPLEEDEAIAPEPMVL